MYDKHSTPSFICVLRHTAALCVTQPDVFEHTLWVFEGPMGNGLNLATAATSQSLQTTILFYFIESIPPTFCLYHVSDQHFQNYPGSTNNTTYIVMSAVVEPKAYQTFVSPGHIPSHNSWSVCATCHILYSLCRVIYKCVIK